MFGFTGSTNNGFGGIGFGGPQGGTMWWVYGLIGLILVFVLLMLSGSKFDLLPRSLDPRPMKWRVEGDMLRFWGAPDLGVPLRIDASEFPSAASLNFTRYSLLLDMVWYNTRAQGDSTKYRHIAHRGSSEVGGIVESSTLRLLEQSGGAQAITGGVTASELNDIGTMPFGLPSRMNPGIMADPVTNDMLIFIDTERGGEFQRESIRIPDIPMDQPFYLGLLVVDNHVEVYINCRLEVTKVLRGMPRSVERDWYGLSGPNPLVAQIQNLRYWNNKALSPREIEPLCPPLTIGKRLECPTA